MKCSSCHAENYDEAEFCWKCKRSLDESGNQFDNNASFLDKADLVASMELVRDSKKRSYRKSLLVPLIEGIIFAIMIFNYVVSADFSGEEYSPLVCYLVFALFAVFMIMVNFALAFLVLRVCNKFNNRLYILWLLFIQYFLVNAYVVLVGMHHVVDDSMQLPVLIAGGVILLICGYFSYRKEHKLLEQLDSEINEMRS